MYNRKDLAELEEKIKGVIDNEGNYTEPYAQKLLDEVTGPATGLVYDHEEGRLNLADGWIFDNNGNIMKVDDVTGPGTGMVYKDGKLVPAE